MSWVTCDPKSTMRILSCTKDPFAGETVRPPQCRFVSAAPQGVFSTRHPQLRLEARSLRFICSVGAARLMMMTMRSARLGPAEHRDIEAIGVGAVRRHEETVLADADRPPEQERTV